MIIELMARAIADAEALRMSGAIYPTGEKLVERNPEKYRDAARAALIALRDGVTPGMIAAVEETGEGVYNDRILAYWTGMIDHVLQEGEKVTDRA